MSADLFTFIALAPCGCIRVAVTDHDDLDYRVLADAQTRGYVVRRVPTVAVRGTSWKCDSVSCPFRPSRQQLDLLEVCK
jgi:hypothetical protein